MMYQDHAMFSGRKGAALAGVAMLHVMLIGAFHFGLAQPIIRHFTPPITVSNIPRPPQKLTVQLDPPKLDDRRLPLDPPENSWKLPPDQDAVVTDAPPVVAKTEERRDPGPPAIAGTSVQMDPKHPLRIGPDYYPAGAVRREQEGRCIVQVTVAADGRIINSSLQSSSGFALLDDACLSAVRGQRMVPATQDGRAVQSTASVPIVWKLSGSH
jgi:protein TonB